MERRTDRPHGWSLVGLALAAILLALALHLLASDASADGTLLVDIGDDLELQEDSAHTFTPWVSYTGGSSSLSYTWDFGDGGVSHQERPSHAYTKSGARLVTLTVSDSDGTTKGDSLTATVYNVRPIADAGSSRTVDEGISVTFDASDSWDTSSDLPLLTYEWDFGDGSAGTGASHENKIVTHTYSMKGIYAVRLVVRDDDWTEADSAQFQTEVITVSGTADGAGTVSFFFDIGSSSGSDGSGTYPIDFYWDFGDGSTASGNSASHTFTADGVYAVTLVITDNLGAMDIETILVTVLNVPPTADAGPSLSGTEDQVLQFAGVATDAGGGLLTSRWDFGDGYGSSSLVATHAYTSKGSYTATLTVTDNGGDSAADTTTVEVANVAPTAAFSVDHTTNEGDVITFDASSTTDTATDLPLLTYSWSFGDGATASGVKVTHAYTDEGSYTATLTVKDNDMATSTATKAFSIQNVAPTASITSVAGPSTPILTGDTVTCTGSATDPGANDAITLTWDFGDGSSGTGTTATHVYTASGTYTVKLTAKDGDGGTGTATKSIIVSKPAAVATTARADAANAPSSSFKGKADQKKIVDGLDEIIAHLDAGQTQDALKDIKAVSKDVDLKVSDATLRANLLAALAHIKSALGG
jgi:PKD repeat protein